MFNRENRFTKKSLEVLTDEELKQFQQKMGPEKMAALKYDWSFNARDNQLPPEGEWTYWMMLTGRGFGKTRAGAETVRELIKMGYSRGGLVGPTIGDVRGTMIIETLLEICPETDRDHKGNIIGRPKHNKMENLLTWENGATAAGFSAEEPDRIRGKNHDFLWCDELAAWKYVDSWDQAQFTLRSGHDPKCIITTTPKPRKMIKDLINDPDCIVTTGSTYDNKENLAPTFFKKIIKTYEGTSLGAQELLGKYLEESKGALWKRNLLEKTRVMEIPADVRLVKTVVGVDPATTADEEKSAETGIVVAALGSDDHVYILDDRTGTYTPGEWALQVQYQYYHYDADMVVCEGNQGGEMVRHTVHSVDPTIDVQIVHAIKGKKVRAQPIQGLYERGEVHHVGDAFDELEDQMTSWEYLKSPSPDRIDALVWAVAHCKFEDYSDPFHQNITSSYIFAFENLFFDAKILRPKKFQKNFKKVLRFKIHFRIIYQILKSESGSNFSFGKISYFGF